MESDEFRSDDDWSKGREIKKLKLNNLEHLFIQFGFRVVVEFDAPRLESIILNYRPAEDKAGQPTETIRFASTSTMKKSTVSGLFPDEWPMNFYDVKCLHCAVQEKSELDLMLSTFPAPNVLEIVETKNSFHAKHKDVLV